jgi:hypothetical protein
MNTRDTPRVAARIMLDRDKGIGAQYREMVDLACQLEAEIRELLIQSKEQTVEQLAALAVARTLGLPSGSH